MTDPFVLFEAYHNGRSFCFSDLCDVVCVVQPRDVGPALDRIEAAVDSGLHAAGFMSYEAASGLDTTLKTRPAGDLPLLWFGLFRNREDVVAGTVLSKHDYQLGMWQPSVSRADYDDILKHIRDYILAGDTYQVNCSFRLRAGFAGDSLSFYRDLCQSQRTDYSAYLDVGRFQILSASPELFFSLHDGVLTARPMKGTAPRGRYWEEDRDYAEQLHRSEKERAENVMIVDLLRNDMGRVSQAGSVQVSDLWQVEQYETVLQMTSSVRSKLRPDVGLRTLMTALFPCGSVTGAPKVRTMEIIAEVEKSERGIYTGAIGYISPGKEMAFNVAIRTVCIDRESGMAEFGVGSGVTYDSSSDGEYRECVNKARLLGERRPDFDLFETLRYDLNSGFFLLDRHLDRLEQSAGYFGFVFYRDAVVSALDNAVAQLEGMSHRVRIILSRLGALQVETAPLTKKKPEALITGISDCLVGRENSLLFHKTTHRDQYTSRLHSDWDEVILVNAEGEVTECSIGNLVAEIQGEYVTPPVSCGLLAGTFRAELLALGKIKEQVLTVDDVVQADGLYMINSVREWSRLKLAE